MTNYFCKYCGSKASSVSSLTSATCVRHPSQRLEELAPDRVRVHFRLSELVEVKSWVLSFGGAATVIAPDALRELVREEADQMKRNYE